MNQILENQKNRLLIKKLHFLQFCIIFLFLSILIINFFWQKYSKSTERKTSTSLTKSYNISRLYSNNSKNNIKTNNDSTSIIGKVEIPKINISYPIFSKCSDELLKISICKFHGPNINKIGNLCIVGHNYNNSTFFSNLNKLNIKDIIYIYDEKNRKILFEIYKIYEVTSDDVSCLSQETNR